MEQKLIVIDGKTYKSVEEMPPDVRAQYEQAMNAFKDSNQNNVPDAFENMNILADKNNNGMPDVFENMPMTNVMTSSMKFLVNGEGFNSLDELPPDIRAKYEQAMGTMDANKNGIPDFVEGMIGTQKQTNNVASSFGIEYPRPASRQPMPANSTTEPESSGGWMLALAGIILVGVCLVVAAAGVWYFFYR